MVADQGFAPEYPALMLMPLRWYWPGLLCGESCTNRPHCTQAYSLTGHVRAQLSVHDPDLSELLPPSPMCVIHVCMNVWRCKYACMCACADFKRVIRGGRGDASSCVQGSVFVRKMVLAWLDCWLGWGGAPLGGRGSDPLPAKNPDSTVRECSERAPPPRRTWLLAPSSRPKLASIVQSTVLKSVSCACISCSTGFPLIWEHTMLFRID